MGVKAMAAVMEHSQATLGSRLVMLALADRYNDSEGTDPFPSIEWIAKITKLSPRAVQLCIKRLVERGEISVQYQASRYGTNVYKLLLPGLSTGGEDFAGVKNRDAKVHPNQKEPLLRDISKSLSSGEETAPPRILALATRMSEACKYPNLTEAIQIVTDFAAELDLVVIDEAIGYTLQGEMTKKPRNPAYFRTMLTNWARQRGVEVAS